MEADQLDVEQQLCIRRDDSGHALGPIAIVRADGQVGPLSLAHLRDTLVPACKQ